ncbi:MAG: von Willebrand factor type A domain-containing protein [Acidobacteriota bacterium]
MSWDEKDIIETLTPKDRPEPPADLLGKLRHDVPVSMAAPRVEHRARPRVWFAWLGAAALAASLLLVVTLRGGSDWARNAKKTAVDAEALPTQAARIASVTPTAMPTAMPSAPPRPALDPEARRTLESLGYIGSTPASSGGAVVRRGDDTVTLGQSERVHEKQAPEQDGLSYRDYGRNHFVDTSGDRFSTFALDVDTGSYTLVRRYLDEGRLPPPGAVRVEEMVNALDYGDRPPESGDFALHADGAPSPFAEGRYLVRFNIKAREVEAVERKPAVLTFVVDVSGSMKGPQRLGLVKQAMTLLLAELRRDDMVGLVVFGTNGRVLLEPTSDKNAIAAAIDSLHAEGSTNAEEGLVLGYRMADRYYESRAINRVILCSDGVANVGRTGPEGILARIREEAGKGIELSTVGFGMGSYNDALMEQLADQGDGVYAYVDGIDEAKRIFVDNLTGTLETIAVDAKAQVEWNPSLVARYRLIGYENRDVADHQFRDDQVDGGEIGAGHSVTVLYQVEPVRGAHGSDPIATLHLRYEGKASGRVREDELPVYISDLASTWGEASRALRLASVVAELGDTLRAGALYPEAVRELGSRAEVFADDGDPAVRELLAMVRKLPALRR